MNVNIINKKFHRIILKKCYIRKINPKETTIRNLLCYYQSISCSKFPNEDLFNRFLANAYDMRFKVNVSTIACYSIFSYTLEAVDPKFINDDSYNLAFLENSLEECIKPLIVNDSFDEEVFRKSFEIYYSNLLYLEENDSKLALNGAIHEFFKGTIRDFNNDGSIDELKKITKDDLFKCYLSLLNDEEIYYAAGDVDGLTINHTLTITPKTNYVFNNRVNHKSYIEVNKKTNQCYLNIIYDTGIFSTDKLFYPLSFFNYALGGSSDSLLFKIVREKNSLCYSISSSYLGASGILIVSAIINKNDLNRVISLIDDCILNACDNINLDEIKKAFIFEKKGRSDYLSSGITDHFMDNYFVDGVKSYDEINLINKIKLDDVKVAAYHVKKSLVYVYGGDLDE